MPCILFSVFSAPENFPNALNASTICNPLMNELIIVVFIRSKNFNLDAKMHTIYSHVGFEMIILFF